MKGRIDYPRTRAALAVYDGEKKRFDSQINNASTSEQVTQWLRDTSEASDKVRRAFLEDTTGINTWSHCKVVSISHLRELCA